MKFGLIIARQHPPGVSMVDRFREHVDQVHAARDAGFDLILMGQHYLSTPFQEIQTMPQLGRLAAEAGTMRVGATVLLLPLLNPVDVAKQVATLDIITEAASSSGRASTIATRNTRPSASKARSAFHASSSAST
jgi:alkanesulfonate monooxygenase SsuD/methylene tetrahydromethanopterin reductase-like flavin-dependent oxidoreductase (luciferase family)